VKRCVLVLCALGCAARPAPVPSGSPEPLAVPPSVRVGAAEVAPCSRQRAGDLLLEDAGSADVVFVGGFGGWFTYRDQAGSSNVLAILPPDGFGGGGNAARMHGRLASARRSYAGMGISLGNQPFDASMYRGVRFRARVAEGSSPKVRFTVSDIHTVPAGGLCTSCFNHFGADLVLSRDWRGVELSFQDLKQAPGWGDPFPALAVNAVYALGWEPNEQGKSFDVWVDDIAFIGCR